MEMPFYVPGPEGGMVPVSALPLPTNRERRRERYERWAEMARAGMSGYEIATKENVSAPTIYSAMRKMGVSFVASRVGRRSERTQARAQRVNEIYLREGTLEAAGKVLGITRERVRQILCAGGFLARIDRVLDVRPPIEWWQMRVDFEAGESLGAIAHRHGVNLESCKARIRRVGGDTRKQSKLLPFVPRMRADYEAGLGFGQIGAKYGFSAMAVHRHLLAAGVKSRPVGTYERRRA
jgi:hypothetical protein